MEPSKSPLPAYIFSIVLFVSLFEVSSFVVFKLGLLEQMVFRGTGSISTEEFKKYLEDRDEKLGWPTKTVLAQRHEGNGYRKSPALKSFGNDKPPCLAVYGDSFAFAEEVSDANAWPDKLSGILGCKVLNYGVGAYGTDQALMRFEALHPDGVRALMTFIDADLERNRNQVRGLWNGIIELRRSKPRFLERNDPDSARSDLETIGLPINNYEDVASLQNSENLNNVLKHEFFLPDTSVWSAVTPSFPYSYSALKLVRNILIKNKIAGYRNLAGKQDFITRMKIAVSKIAPAAVSRNDVSIRLQTLILTRFLRVCKEKHIRCGILRLPDLAEVQFQYEDSHVLNELKAVEVIREHILELSMDCLHREFAARNVSKNEIMSEKMPGAHYSSVANQVLAVCLGNVL